MAPTLSMMMPGIRPHNWDGLYQSIRASLGSDDFEIIFVGPYNLPKSLEQYKNIKLVRDYGSPTRAFGIALELVEGEYITWAADDATYHKGMLRVALDALLGGDENSIIAMEQTEAVRYYHKDSCRINADEGIKCLVPNDYYFFPTALMHTKLYKELGGLNCDYQTHAMAHLDFAIRAQMRGVKVGFIQKPVLHLTHMMGVSGDHGPICITQTYEDQPLFLSRYRDPNYKPDIRINPQNWRDQDLVWTKRFTPHEA